MFCLNLSSLNIWENDCKEHQGNFSHGIIICKAFFAYIWKNSYYKFPTQCRALQSFMWDGLIVPQRPREIWRREELVELGLLGETAIVSSDPEPFTRQRSYGILALGWIHKNDLCKCVLFSVLTQAQFGLPTTLSWWCSADDIWKQYPPLDLDIEIFHKLCHTLFFHLSTHARLFWQYCSLVANAIISELCTVWIW